MALIGQRELLSSAIIAARIKRHFFDFEHFRMVDRNTVRKINKRNKKKKAALLEQDKEETKDEPEQKKTKVEEEIKEKEVEKEEVKELGSEPVTELKPSEGGLVDDTGYIRIRGRMVLFRLIT